MSTTNQPPSSPDSEELVAYLDGELPPDNCRRVERRLSDDEAYRLKLTELEQAWSALDELPHAAARDDFARTTIEMVALTAERESADEIASKSFSGRAAAAAVARSIRRRELLLGICCALLATAGFAAVRSMLPDSNRELIDDLPVVVQLDVLVEVGELDFLRGMYGIDFGSPTDDPSSISAALVPNASSADWDTPASRRAWIEQLPAGSQAELAVKLTRFHSLSPATERDRLRRLEREIAAADDRDQLWATLAAYGQWIKTLTPGKRTELREIESTDERLREVEQLVRQSDRQPQHLSLADEKALQEAILDFVDGRRQQLMQELRRRGVPDHERRVEGRSMAVVALLVIGREIREERVQEFLISRLSPAIQDHMDSLSRRQRTRQLREWCRDALDPRFGPQELEEFFVEGLDNDQREQLLSLPQTEMRAQLEQLYLGSQVGLRGPDWLRDDGPGRFERGGPGPPNRGRRDRFIEDGPPRRGPPPREFDNGQPDRRRSDRRPDGPPPRNAPPPDEPI
jgi:hypothetical protein